MTEAEIREFCARYPERVFVRAKLNYGSGGWGSISIAELSESERTEWIDYFAVNEFLPGVAER